MSAARFNWLAVPDDELPGEITIALRTPVVLVDDTRLEAVTITEREQRELRAFQNEHGNDPPGDQAAHLACLMTGLTFGDFDRLKMRDSVEVQLVCSRFCGAAGADLAAAVAGAGSASK